MGSCLRGSAKILFILSFVCLALLGAALGFLHSPFFRYPVGSEYPPARIDELIWPTIGCPAMVLPGGVLEVEMELGEEEAAIDAGAEAWAAYLSPVREELVGLSWRLEPLEVRVGSSRRWPYRSTQEKGEKIWSVSFRVPEDALPELYDLRVEADAGGARVSDGQPHAVAVMENDDGDFTFITLADIHVHERDNSSLLSKQTNHGISETGEPAFFYRAIEQVNLIRPDFVLMLGDYVRGQRRPGELAREYERLYRALLELEVPAFLVPGNHDQYVNGIDGARWFEDNLGPLYYSFDVGDSHFTCLNSYQWPEDDRVVMNKLFFMEPRRWQGQVLDAADEGDPSTYKGQLAWLKEDLAAHEDAALRVMAMHHDPYSVKGEGWSYRNLSYLGGLHRTGGGGKGAEALRILASRHRVHAVFGGHLHLDTVGSLPWEDGGGNTVYSCQTCVYFDAGGRSDHYPGYRLVKVEDWRVASFSYLDGVASYPFYDGSLPGETVDLDLLERPALWKEPRYGSGTWTRGEMVVGNYLACSVELRGLIVETAASPSGIYEVAGAEVYRVVGVPGAADRALLYLRTTVGAGIPGEAGDRPGTPALKRITVCVDSGSAAVKLGG